jgi:outer membrane lipoprotein SlyB
MAQADPTPAKPMCRDCGTVEGIREVKQRGDGSGIGAVAGGVAGAVLGRNVGNGRGRTIATVVGALGGALAGHQVEKHVRTNTAYEVSVRMEDGSVRTVTETAQPTWRSGDKVRIENGRIAALG